MSVQPPLLPPMAGFGPWTARDLLDITSDPTALDSTGRWAVTMTFEGELTCARFASWTLDPPVSGELGAWIGPQFESWQTSLSRTEFIHGVRAIRSAIEAGDVYQVNLCRELSAELPEPDSADICSLAGVLADGNPAPYGGFLRLPKLEIASASPELFLERNGTKVMTGPIKGTGVDSSQLSAKDEAENIMIVDLMRNDLGRICQPGSIEVPNLLELEQHPGLVHLVSKVTGQLRGGVTWSEILTALAPPGSVSGAPKLSALTIISQIEGQNRGPYCGVLGWVDADKGEANLSVGIRTFWKAAGALNFGTGAGITWGSSPKAEWAETELKANRLLQLAALTSNDPTKTIAPSSDAAERDSASPSATAGLHSELPC